MSLKFQIRKWDVEISWEQLTLTPPGAKDGDSFTENKPGIIQTNNTNYFLFNLIENLFTSTHKQEHLSQ